MAVYNSQQEQVASMMAKGGLLGNGFSVAIDKNKKGVVTMHIKNIKHDDAPDLVVTIKEK